MPMIDVTLPAGAISAEARDQLGEQLTSTLLKWEGAGDMPFAREITVVYFDERPPATIYHAGKQASAARWRLLVTIPEGAITDDARKAGLVEELTQLVLDAEGADAADALRVWVLINEVRDGHWGGGGRVVRLRDIAQVARNGADSLTAA